MLFRGTSCRLTCDFSHEILFENVLLVIVFEDVLLFISTNRMKVMYMSYAPSTPILTLDKLDRVESCSISWLIL